MKPIFHGVLIVLVGVMPAYAGGHALNVVGAHCYPQQQFKGYGHQNYGYNAVHHYYHGYMVGQPIRDDAAAEKLADKMLPLMEQKLDAVVADFKADLKGRFTVEFGAQASGSSGASVTGGTGNLANVQAIFNESCVSCHSGTSAKKGLDLSDASKLSSEMLMKCALKVHLGTMPPAPADPVSQDKSDYLLKIAEGL